MNNHINNFKRYEHIKSQLIVDGCSNSLSPDISIVIPTYRRHLLIKDTIDSVIQQSGADVIVELVIVDNDAESTDGNLERIVSEYLPFNIRLFRNEQNIGMFGNWNRCIELARAPILTILNDDDLLHPDFIRSAYTSDMQEMRVVTHKTFSDISDCVWPRITSNIEFRPLTPADFFIKNPVPGSLGMVMNRQCALDVGGYNQDLWPTADYDFTYRYFSTYGLKKTATILSAYRWSENESLKVETLFGFLKNDYAFRIKLIDTMQLGMVRNIFLRWLCSLVSVYFSFIYKNVNSNFDAEENIRRALIPPTGLSLLKMRRLHRLFGRIYPVLVKLIVH